jgi:micrococcal nuclease
MAGIVPLKRMRGYLGGWRLVLVTILAAAVAAAAGAWLVTYWLRYEPARTTPPARTTLSEIQVVDGDTIRANGVTYRLVGFDTPETIDAKCPEERALGERAAARLRAIVAQGGVNLVVVRCSCAPGTHGTQSCNYGRRCGSLLAKGEDVGRILIRERLARPLQCGAYQCEKRKSWCQ